MNSFIFFILFYSITAFYCVQLQHVSKDKDTMTKSYHILVTQASSFILTKLGARTMTSAYCQMSSNCPVAVVHIYPVLGLELYADLLKNV